MKTPAEQNHPFNTPDAYFDNFTENLMDVIKTNEKVKSKRILSAWLKYSSVAAIILLVLTFTLFRIHENSNIASSSDSINTQHYVLISDSGMKFKQKSNQTMQNSDVIISQDLFDDEIVDWSSTMEFSDEELVVLYSNI